MALIDNVISNWTMSEASGNFADDVSTNTGVNSGAAYGATGKLGDAADFERDESDYVNCGTAAELFFNYNGAFSGVCWINPESFSGNNNIMSKMDLDSPFDGFQFNTIASSGKLRFNYITTATSNQFQETSDSAVISTGSLQLVGFTYNNETIVFYVNGSPVASTTVTNTLSSTPSISDIPFNIGSRDNGTNSFDGIIGSVTVWNRALSASEHSELWNGGAGLAYPFAVGTNMLINIADTFKDVDNLQINIGDVWKDVPQVLLNVGDTWKTVYG